MESDIANEQHDIFTMKKQCSLFLPVKTFTLKRAWSYFDQSDQQAGKKSAKENKAKQKASKHEKYTQQGILLKEEGFLYQSLYKITTAGEGKSCVQQSLAYDLRLVVFQGLCNFFCITVFHFITAYVHGRSWSFDNRSA